MILEIDSLRRTVEAQSEQLNILQKQYDNVDSQLRNLRGVKNRINGMLATDKSISFTSLNFALTDFGRDQSVSNGDIYSALGDLQKEGILEIDRFGNYIRKTTHQSANRL